jgi:hypothetical protein
MAAPVVVTVTPEKTPGIFWVWTHVHHSVFAVGTCTERDLTPTSVRPCVFFYCDVQISTWQTFTLTSATTATSTTTFLMSCSANNGNGNDLGTAASYIPTSMIVTIPVGAKSGSIQSEHDATGRKKKGSIPTSYSRLTIHLFLHFLLSVSL